MQFTAVILMALLTLKLLLLPGKVVVNPMVNKARKLMACGIFLLGIQFLLQYTLHLRAMGVTQAVMLNLFLFIPVSWMISMAVLNLQGKGRIKKTDRWIGGIIWLVTTALIVITAALDGELFSDTPELRTAEITGSVLYATMQCHYAWLALMAPLLIFGSGPWLAIYAIFFITSIFYLVDTFCNYVLSSAPEKMEEAEDSEEEELNEKYSCTGTEISEEKMQRIERFVEQWTKNGSYLKCGLKLPIAAAEIGVPQYQLSGWLKQKNLKYSEWITTLRIEEAKRVLLEYPEWTLEAVAEHCGFNSREYFHRIFRSYLGMPPIKYQQNKGVISE